MNKSTRQVAGALLATTLGLTSVTAFVSTAEAAPPGRINGVVTGAGVGPLAGIYVSTLRWDVSAGEWAEVDSATSDIYGKYSVGKLETGTYRVRYFDPSGSYATEFYKDVTRAADAQPIDISVGKFDAQPTELGGAAHLTGRVTGSDGLGIAGAVVTAYVQQAGAWIEFQSAVAGEDGRYDLGGMPGGSYTLGFLDPASGVSEFWNDQAALEVAESLTVQNSGRSDGLNAVLATPGTQPEPDPTPDPTPTPPTQGPAPTPAVTPAPATATATAPAPTAAAPTATPAVRTVAVLRMPKIKGFAKVDQRLRITKGAWNPSTAKRKLQWLANGKKIKGATKMRLRLTKKQAGKKISVRVVARASGMTPVTVRTKATKRVKR